jgi:hypothetical protein
LTFDRAIPEYSENGNRIAQVGALSSLIKTIGDGHIRQIDGEVLLLEISFQNMENHGFLQRHEHRARSLNKSENFISSTLDPTEFKEAKIG